MARWIRAMVLMTTVLAAAVPALAQVELATSGPGGTAFTWTGTRANALAGAVLNRVDINGDVNRPDLLVGAPGSGPGGPGASLHRDHGASAYWSGQPFDHRRDPDRRSCRRSPRRRDQRRIDRAIARRDCRRAWRARWGRCRVPLSGSVRGRRRNALSVDRSTPQSDRDARRSTWRRRRCR